MDSSSQEGGEKKKVTEVKTFPVQFSLGEKKENITNTTNTPSKPSKEQIINQAIQFHLKGNIPEALKCYQYFYQTMYEQRLNHLSIKEGKEEQ